MNSQFLKMKRKAKTKSNYKIINCPRCDGFGFKERNGKDGSMILIDCDVCGGFGFTKKRKK